MCKHSTRRCADSPLQTPPSHRRRHKSAWTMDAVTHRHHGAARCPLPGRDGGLVLPSPTIGKVKRFRNHWSLAEQVQPDGPTKGPQTGATSVPHLVLAVHTWVLDTLWKAYLDTHFQGRSDGRCVKSNSGRQLARANTGRRPRRAEQISRRGQRTCVNCGQEGTARPPQTEQRASANILRS